MVRDRIQKLASNCIIDNNFDNIILNIAPRVGKTKIAIDSVKNSPFKNIVVSTPRRIICEVWKNEKNKWRLNKDIKIICNASLKNLKSCDLLILDEIHSLSSKQIEYIKDLNCKKIGLTGSLSKDNEKILNYELQMKVKFKYSLDEAIQDKIISDYRINIIFVNLDNTKKIKVERQGKTFISTELDHYNWLTNKFNQLKFLSFSNPNYNFAKMKVARERANFIYKSETKLKKAKDLVNKLNRCLIFTTRVDGANFLCQDSYHYKTSEENKIEDFYNMKINKLSVVNLADMGLTFPSLKDSVIHQLQSNDEIAIQKVLRMCNFDQGKIAQIFITVYKDTVDEEWLNKGLSLFNKSKINYL